MKLFLQNSNLYDHDTSTSQTDGQTDRRTTCHGNTALRVASRGKNRPIFDEVMPEILQTLLSGHGVVWMLDEIVSYRRRNNRV